MIPIGTTFRGAVRFSGTATSISATLYVNGTSSATSVTLGTAVNQGTAAQTLQPFTVLTTGRADGDELEVRVTATVSGGSESQSAYCTLSTLVGSRASATNMTTVVTRLTAQRALNLDFLDASILSRQPRDNLDALSDPTDLLYSEYPEFSTSGIAVEQTSVDGGWQVSVDTDSGAEPITFAWHVSTAADFTPGPANVIEGQETAVAAIPRQPGTGPFYVRTVATDTNGATAISPPRPLWPTAWPLASEPAGVTPAGKQTRHVYFSDSRGESSSYNDFTSPIAAMVAWLTLNTSMIATSANYSVAGTTAVTFKAAHYAAALAAEGGTFAGRTIHVAFGVNEAQAGQTASVFIAGLVTLIAACLADGADKVFVHYPTFREAGRATPTDANVIFPAQPYTALIQTYQTALDAMFGQPLDDADGNPLDPAKVLVGDRKSYVATAMFPGLYLKDRLHPNQVGAILAGRFMGETTLAGERRQFDTTTQRSAVGSIAKADQIQAKTDLIATSNADSPRMIQAAADAGSAATNALTAGAAATDAASGVAVVVDRLPSNDQLIAGVDDLDENAAPPSNRTITINNRTVTT